MAEHYYTNQPTARHDRKFIETVLRGKRLKLATDAGVFSRNEVDYGSRFLIETMNIAEDARVLDMGCGYGPIGLSAALLAVRGHVVMADVNERALELARENARLNGIGNVRIVQSDLFEQVPEGPYTVIVSNPPIRAGKQVVHRLFEQSLDFLAEGGELWIVIQKKQGAPSAIARLEQLFSDVQVVDKSKGYRVIRAVR